MVGGHVEDFLLRVRSFVNQRASAPFAEDEMRFHVRLLENLEEPHPIDHAGCAGDAYDES